VCACLKPRATGASILEKGGATPGCTQKGQNRPQAL
jgi:hypothetical protein